ncbi:DarT ssDNA thymidine ADP-ribosyltransferase family protein [Halioglobus sp. Uisw_031]|uniref:DarT ssDNA thymidine ADP-ribosyltransferase family protein n=1 Tax=Halioglobus sp. Uisw_031 TaxID=3230977 RepID=UPI0039E801AA
MAYEYLNPEKGLIWRIAHRDNVEWVLANGLCSANSGIQDPNFTAIGNPDLIDRRQTGSIHLPRGGTLKEGLKNSPKGN